MRTAQQGTGTIPAVAPGGPAAPPAAHGQVTVPVGREDVVRRPSGASRFPPVPEPITEAALDEVDDVLIEDARAGLSPAEMVERKLHSLLRTRGVSIELAGRFRPGRGRGPRA
jgi:hypothetical protein